MRKLSEITIEEAQQVFGWLGHIVEVNNNGITYRSNLFDFWEVKNPDKFISFISLFVILQQDEKIKLEKLGIKVEL